MARWRVANCWTVKIETLEETSRVGRTRHLMAGRKWCGCGRDVAKVERAGHHARGGYIAASALGTIAWRGFCGRGLRTGYYAAAAAAAATGLIAIVWILLLMPNLLFLRKTVSIEAMVLEGNGLLRRLGASNDSSLRAIDFSNDRQ